MPLRRLVPSQEVDPSSLSTWQLEKGEKIGTPEALIKAVRLLALSPVVLLVITAGRLLIIANYDVTTALGIASAGGVIGTLVGTILPLLPVYLPVAAIFALFLQKFGVFIILATATAVLSPAFGNPNDGARETWEESQRIVDFASRQEWQAIWLDYRISAIAFLAGTGFAIYYFMSAILHGLAGFAFGRLFKGVLVALLIAPLPLFVQKVYQVPFDPTVASEVARRPWLPVEEIALKTHGSRLGYTLATKDGWYLILNEGDRTVEYFPAAEVVGRRVCSLSEQEYRLPAVPIGEPGLSNPEICQLVPPRTPFSSNPQSVTTTVTTTTTTITR